MGKNANKRTATERAAHQLAQAQEAALEMAEVLIFLGTDAGNLKVQIQPRDETPDEDSPAVIFATFLHFNMHTLIPQAMAAYRKHKAPANQPSPIVTEREPRSIILADGNLARQTDDVNIIVPASVERPAASDTSATVKTYGTGYNIDATGEVSELKPGDMPVEMLKQIGGVDTGGSGK